MSEGVICPRLHGKTVLVLKIDFKSLNLRCCSEYQKTVTFCVMSNLQGKLIDHPKQTLQCLLIPIQSPSPF